MGLDILLRSSKLKEGYNLDGFDISRFIFDREFAMQDFFEVEYPSYYDEPIKYRIKDLNKALSWINTIPYEGNRERLTKLVTEIYNNDFLWIEFSY